MSSRSMRMALSALALMPAAAQPAPDVAAPTHDAAPSNSTLDVPIEDIAASVRGCAILDKDFPRLRGHPMYGFFKSMSLNQIAAMSSGEITPDMLAQARTDLSGLALDPVVHSDQPTDLEDPAPPGDRTPSASQAPPGDQASSGEAK
jgi:hypothetical protein